VLRLNAHCVQSKWLQYSHSMAEQCEYLNQQFSDSMAEQCEYLNQGTYSESTAAPETLTLVIDTSQRCVFGIGGGGYGRKHKANMTKDEGTKDYWWAKYVFNFFQQFQFPKGIDLSH